MTTEKTRPWLPVLLAVVLGFCPAARAGAAKVYTPTKVDKAPGIDGRLDDPCWGRARKVTRFVKVPFGVAAKPADAGSVAMLCHDKENLYVAVECLEVAISKINKRFTERDDPLWGDDCVEIFIAPDYLDRSRYTQFAVNALGTQTDQKARGMRGFDMGWNGAWKAAARVLKDRWVVEVRIPFADLGVRDPAAVNLMGVAVCRERKAERSENTVWEIGGSFHRADGLVVFTSLKKFVEDDLVPWWRGEKAAIAELLKARDALRPEMRAALEKIVQTTDEVIGRVRNAPSPEAIAATVDSVRDAVRKAGALKRDVRFNVFVARLRKIVASGRSGR